jgi:acetyl-CoA acyltransferase 2
MTILKNVFIVAAKRTAFGKFGGKLKDLTATELQVIANKAAIEQSKLTADKIDTVIVGNILPSSIDCGYLARHSALKAGVPQNVPACTINRLCGSGFQSIVYGAQEIALGDAKVALCGGTENMSLAPYTLRGNRFGTRLGTDLILEDLLWGGLTDSHVKMPMALTAEKLAELHKISREDADLFALQSQQRWQKAQDSGAFKDEIVPIPVKGKKGPESFCVDEHPRGNATIQELNKLPAVFKKGGTVTAGNASGICDGAGAIILADEETVKANNLKPLARLVSYHVSGVDPSIMGIGPVPAIQNLLKKNKLTIDQIDLFDINEAFAVQFLAVQKELGLNPEKSNVNGGAIALGHPLAASGSRITANLIYELIRRKGKYAVGGACIGGGQGIAVLLQSV